VRPDTFDRPGVLDRVGQAFRVREVGTEDKTVPANYIRYPGDILLRIGGYEAVLLEDLARATWKNAVGGAPTQHYRMLEFADHIGKPYGPELCHQHLDVGKPTKQVMKDHRRDGFHNRPITPVQHPLECVVARIRHGAVLAPFRAAGSTVPPAEMRYHAQ